jgi:hypothetical protein
LSFIRVFSRLGRKEFCDIPIVKCIFRLVQNLHNVTRGKWWRTSYLKIVNEKNTLPSWAAFFLSSINVRAGNALEQTNQERGPTTATVDSERFAVDFIEGNSLEPFFSSMQRRAWPMGGSNIGGPAGCRSADNMSPVVESTNYALVATRTAENCYWFIIECWPGNDKENWAEQRCPCVV